MESDSKVCVDALLQNSVEYGWNIITLCNDTLSLANNFVSCNFIWVKREANMAAHMLAKFVPPQALLVFYFPNNIPAPLEEAWYRDFHCILFFLLMK